ncbi:dead box ATP-dependent RNA helicase, putative [Ricinus communis]|uniref:Dead box ATP-dependent RNA helicase, putative n=1 Tax=Ricinus communis TaxID=3988 RepID=B9SY26_RICCO|nr:dead box ATP-dependent RNA helicase, putative [Ricinus communis]
MAKGDDTVTKKRNKAKRKKLNRENSSNVSARVASIIAAKKRRLSGKRRMCQGMCFSLPTLDDPFNERHGRMDINVKDKKKKVNTREKVQLNGNDLNHQEQACDYSDGPSKFFILCLNAIEKALRHDGTYNDEEKPLLVNPWGLEFLKFCSIGKDILETSGSSCTIEQIAWIVSIAADAIARKEKEGLSFSSPFLLFLVPSQEKAAKVRMVCKPLKDLGVHTVSLHAGASLDHQIRGLKSCEPEFLVSTPERLMELISLKAIDITGVSFLVVDGLDSLYQDGSLGSLKSIRQSISGNPHTVAFNNLFNHACVPALQNLFVGSINRLSLSDSICSQSACIFQTIEVCTSEQKKLSKLCSHRLKLLFIVENNKKAASLVKILKSNGYSVSTESNCEVSNVDTRMKPVVSVINAEHISTADLGVYEIIILPNFVLSIDNYIQILTRMARHTTHGILHSFMTEEDALLAGPLIEILEQCGQAVPETLRTLHLRSSMSE